MKFNQQALLFTAQLENPMFGKNTASFFGVNDKSPRRCIYSSEKLTGSFQKENGHPTSNNLFYVFLDLRKLDAWNKVRKYSLNRWLKW